MGAGSSCQNLRLSSNYLCNIGDCTLQVVGIDSNSNSPSDIWFITVEEGTKYGILELKGEIVLKLFLSLDCTANYLNMKAAQQLTYESNIYEHVVDPILQYQMNPYFVQYYGRALGCSFSAINNILRHHTVKKDSHQIMTDEETAYALGRNTTYMGNDVAGRPSINTVVEFEDVMDHMIARKTLKVKDSLKYGMILTQKSTGKTAYEWLSDHLSDDGKFDIEAWLVIIQFVTALGTLAQFKCVHNDMHLGNLFVNPHDRETYTFVYTEPITNEKYMFGITSNWSAAVYDWDRAYMEKLGPNPLLSDTSNGLCDVYGNCNEYIPQKDLAKFFVNCIGIENNNNVSPDSLTKNFLLDLLFDESDNKYKQYFVDNVISSPFLLDSNTDKAIENEFYIDGMKPVNRVLSQLVDKIAIEYGAESYTIENKLGINTPILTQLYKYNPEIIEHSRSTSTIFDFSTDRVDNMLNLVCGGPCNHNKDCDDGEICIDNKCCKGFITKSQLEYYADLNNKNCLPPNIC